MVGMSTLLGTFSQKLRIDEIRDVLKKKSMAEEAGQELGNLE